MSYGKRITWLTDQEANVHIDIQQAKRIILFDMDGTLTEPRKDFDKSLLPSLLKLSEKANIGIVTGSDIDYLKQQLGFLINLPLLKQKIHLLPCNGTKYYAPPSVDDQHTLTSSVNMKDHLGEYEFKQIMISLIEQQSSINFSEIPLTGHFISYRGSMINWCPIGRNAGDMERKQFVQHDISTSPSYREKMIQDLQKKLHSRNVYDSITIKLGGSTSFDIYPKGWNKTYCLNHFPDWQAWFVGDRCGENGNDKEIYDLLRSNNKSFETKSTHNTKEIINNKIIPQL